jgi:arylformamidase
MTWYDGRPEVIDLTTAINDGLQAHVRTSVIPLQRIGDAAARFDPPCEGFASNLLVMSDHCGTHVDAPSHFVPGGANVDRIDPATLIGRGSVVDLTSCPGPEVDGNDLPDLECLVVSGTSIVLLHTRPAGGTGKGLNRAAAERLVASGVTAVGTDHSGIDDTRNRTRPGHMTLLSAGIPVVERLTNLDRLPGRSFVFVALPLPIVGGTGSPVRAVALVPATDAGGDAE